MMFEGLDTNLNINGDIKPKKPPKTSVYERAAKKEKVKKV